MHKKTFEEVEKTREELYKESMTIDLNKINSPAMRRIIEDIRNDHNPNDISAYNRVHNRHNRSGTPQPWPRPKEPQ